MEGRNSDVVIARVSGLRSKRAPRACEACRSRKVRCDVTRTKSPCTNCRLDGKTCTVPASKRRHIGDRVLGSSFFEGKKHNPQSPICDAIIDFGDLDQDSPKATHYGDVEVAFENASLEAFDLLEDGFHVPNPIGMPDVETNNAIASEQTFQPDMLASYPSPTQTVLGDRQCQSLLPPYITPLPKSISTEDLEYLQGRGAFDIPSPAVRDSLLELYAKWVHPFTPMLDLHEILSAVYDNGSNGTISFLIFQSILFAATAFSGADAGYRSRKRTRKVFYERAKLLHDFDVETNRLAISQAAILLSFWDGDSDGVRDSYYWIGIASLHASSIGLNFDPASNFLDLKIQRRLKMTWWSLLIRDRLLAVATRRPVQNKAFRFDVPMLGLEDFELESLLETLQSTLQVWDMGLPELEVLASSCMALAQLSEYIDKVLSVQYTAQRTPGGTCQRAAIVLLVPRTVNSKFSEISDCGQELQNWYGYLPTEVQQLGLKSNKPEYGQEHEVVKVHRALVAGYYSMTLMTLYRPLLNLSPAGIKERKLRKISMQMVCRAAKSITDIFSELYARNLISRLPDTAVAALEPAVATHLLYSMSEVAKIRDTSFQKFYLCWRILLQFGESYSLAETAMTMLTAAAQRLKSLPDLKTHKPAPCSRLVDEMCSTDDAAAKCRDSVPFVGVVGDQKKDRSDVTIDWTTQSQESGPSKDGGKAVGHHDHEFDSEANCALDAMMFEQLVSWDAHEGAL